MAKKRPNQTKIEEDSTQCRILSSRRRYFTLHLFCIFFVYFFFHDPGELIESNSTKIPGMLG